MVKRKDVKSEKFFTKKAEKTAKTKSGEDLHPRILKRFSEYIVNTFEQLKKSGNVVIKASAINEFIGWHGAAYDIKKGHQTIL